MDDTWFAYVQHTVENYFDMARPAHLQAYDLLWLSTLTQRF